MKKYSVILVLLISGLCFGQGESKCKGFNGAAQEFDITDIQDRWFWINELLLSKSQYAYYGIDAIDTEEYILIKRDDNAPDYGRNVIFNKDGSFECRTIGRTCGINRMPMQSKGKYKMLSKYDIWFQPDSSKGIGTFRICRKNDKIFLIKSDNSFDPGEASDPLSH